MKVFEVQAPVQAARTNRRVMLECKRRQAMLQAYATGVEAAITGAGRASRPPRRTAA
jgi:hypothetical protein